MTLSRVGDICTLAEVPGLGLPRAHGLDDLSESVRIAVLPWPAGAEMLDEIRTRFPALQIVAWLEELDEAALQAAIEARVDATAIGETQLAQCLEDWRHRIDNETVVECIREIAANPELQSVLNVAILRMARLFCIEQVSVVLFKPGDEIGFVVAEREGALENLVIRMADYPELQEVTRTRKPLVISDIFGDKLLHGVRERLERAGVRHRSAVLFPLVRKNAAVGALFMRSEEEMGDVDVRLLATGRVIASVTSIAIGSALEQDMLRRERHLLLQGKQEADQALEDLRDFVGFFEEAPDGLVVTHRDGVVQYVNRAAGYILCRDPAELGGSEFVEILSPQYRRLAERALSGRSIDHERGYVDLLVPAGDREVVISAAIRPVRESDAVLITFRDVTEPREIESELRQTKEFLENLIQSSVDAVIAADTAGTVILFNRSAEEMLGYGAREVVGLLTLDELFSEGEVKDVMRRLRADAYGGRGRLDRVQKELIDKTGAVVPISLTASLIYEAGAEIASVGIYTDLRDRMKMEEKLSEVQRRLHISERQAVAVELAGAAAHELNQPLTSIMGYAELLKRRVGEDDQNRKPVDVICREVERMAAIVRRLGQITDYRSKAYVGRSTILDLSESGKGPREE